MADYIHYITWYTVYSAKTGEVVAAGTSSMCAAKLGYKTANSFASSVGHRRHEKGVRTSTFLSRSALIVRRLTVSLRFAVTAKRKAGIRKGNRNMNGRYMRAAEIRWHNRQPERLWHIHQKKEKKKVSTVQIFDADLRFVNEIPMPNTLAGIQYADQLAAEKPGRLYVVMDEHRQKVYQR